MPLNYEQLFSNGAVSLLAAPLSATDATLSIMAGHGAMFPQPANDGSNFFLITLENQTATAREIVRVTARSGDVLTLIRAQEGTTAQAWGATLGNDTLVDHRITAGSLYRLANEYKNSGFPALTDYRKAIDHLLAGAISGQSIIDASVLVTVDGAETVITTPSAYEPGTTAVYVGGLRQKRGIDFLESGPNELRLQFVLEATQIAAGQNVVTDYVAA